MKIEGNKFHDKLIITPSKNKAQLEITTLGGLSIRRDGQLIPSLHSRKAQALLLYLAVTSRPQPREVLADLLWEEFSQKRAMNNLRVVLSNLRKHLGDRLLITRDTAAMNPDVDYDLDVALLEANLSSAGDFERKTGTLDQEVISRIEQAVELYKGEFLSGFFVENAMEFDAWMVVERERFHHLVLDGLGKLVRWELAQGAYTVGIRHASKWVQLEPLSEAAHRQMMRLLALGGERSASLAQYHKCREILADELGLDPDSRTSSLYEGIRDGSISTDLAIPKHIPPSDVRATDVRHHNLPIQTTPFIGRETELANLRQLLMDQDVRLVTVIGAGGMGKTRLALEAGGELMDQFPDGVFFVSLARLQSEELIPPSVIQVLGIEFARGGPESGDAQTDLKKTLLRNLRRKNLLLILDNFEHLLDGVDLVSEILQFAPEVKILATSRARLNVGGEHRFQVAGMAYPEDANQEDVDSFSAVRLFLQTARRVRSGFKLRLGELVHIAHICRMVEGMPLGIRLAAAWVEVLSLEEIAAEIAQSLDLLQTEVRDVPERHRSIRALYDHSWNLLSPRERDVFQKLSVFRGGCTLEAVQKITGTTLRDLRSLVEKSLLQRALNGRYEIHELSREYAAEKLKVSFETETAVRDMHSAFYNGAICKWGEELKSSRQLSALTEMDLEIDNARAAWNWAVEQRRADLVDQAMEGLRHYFAIHGLQEAEKAFRQATEGFKSGLSGDVLRVYARLLSMQGYFSYGDDRKREFYHQSLQILDQLDGMGHDVRHEKACVLNFMGEVASRSDFEESVRFYRQSLRLFEESGDRYWASDTLFGLGRTYYIWGKLNDSQKIHQRSLANFRELGDLRKIAQILGVFDYIYRRLGEFESAERAARERLEIYEAIGDPSAIALGQGELGVCFRYLGEFDVAESLLEKGMEVYKEFEYFSPFFVNAIELCLVKIELGHYVQAYDLAQSALEWSGGRIFPLREWCSNRDSKARRKGITLTIQGMASLALGKMAKAELLLQRSFEVLQEIQPITLTVLHHPALGITSLNLNQPDQAKEHIWDGLNIGMEISSALVHIPSLGAAALYLADQGDLERAVEIYALASRYPWIAKSQWYQDVIEAPLKNLTAHLSFEVIAAAKKRGRERDLKGTVQELLTELG
jgi:predicted ATPase/DNA-binding SARP family transcriptional activator